jgi:hypothetical protein
MPIDKPWSKTQLRSAAIAAKSAALPKTPDELIDQIVKGQPMTGEEVNAASTASAGIDSGPYLALRWTPAYISLLDRVAPAADTRCR